MRVMHPSRELDELIENEEQKESRSNNFRSLVIYYIRVNYKRIKLLAENIRSK